MKSLHQHLLEKFSWYRSWHEHQHHGLAHALVLTIVISVGLSQALKIEAAPGTTVATTASVAVSVQNKKLLELNNKILSLSYRYQKAPSEEMKEAVLTELVQVAKERKAELLTLIKKNPNDFTQFAFPASVRKNLPSQLAPHVESQSTVEGTYSVSHIDDFENPANSKWEYRLTTKAGKVYHLNAPSDIAIRPNDTVRVTGTTIDDQIILGTEGSSTQTLAAALPKSPIGEQKTAVVIWTVGTSAPTPDQMRNLFFAEPSVNPKSVNAYFKETSFGNTWFTGDVFGPITSPAATNCYENASTLNQKVLQTTGIDITTQYQRIVYVSADGNCGNIASTDGHAYVSGLTTSTFYINSFLGFAYHELGHVLGANHANALNCGTKQIDLFSRCTNDEYGDFYTSMGRNASGGGQAPFQFSAAHKLMLSWLPESNVQYITTDGTYTVYASEKLQTGPQLLSIYKPDFNSVRADGSIQDRGYLSIGFRQAYGFDLGLPSNIINGTSIHLHRGGPSVKPFDRRTYILDSTPGGTTTLQDRGLLDGMTFTDSVNGVSITQLSHTTESATVRVTFSATPPSCVRGQMAIGNVSPMTVVAGQTQAVSFTATNTDTTGCSPSTITFSADVPSGWTVAPATVSIAPAATGTGTIYITPSSSATAGQYQVIYKTTDPLVSLHNAVSAPSTVTIESVVTDSTPPTISLSTPTNGATVLGTISIAATASDNIGVTKVEFYVNNTLVNSDISSPYGFSFDTTTLSNGTHTIMAKAYDAAGNTTNSSTASITVNNILPDTTAPTVSITNPTNNSTISGTTPINVIASDNAGIDHIDFYRGTTLVGADATAPYSLSWDTTTAVNGSYTLSARAYDAAGNNTTSSTVSVTVQNEVIPIPDTTAPTVSLVSPTNGSAVVGTATLTASATDNVGVTRVSFFRGTTLIDTDTTGSPNYSVAWDTTAVPNGTYSLSAKAYDAAGNVGSSSTISVTVSNLSSDTTAPAATLTTSLRGTVITAKTRSITIKGTATDNSGLIARNELLINGTVVATNTNSTSISFKWNTQNLSTGSYTLTVRSYDPAGNVGTDGMIVTR